MLCVITPFAPFMMLLRLAFFHNQYQCVFIASITSFICGFQHYMSISVIVGVRIRHHKCPRCKKSLPRFLSSYRQLFSSWLALGDETVTTNPHVRSRWFLKKPHFKIRHFIGFQRLSYYYIYSLACQFLCTSSDRNIIEVRIIVEPSTSGNIILLP